MEQYEFLLNHQQSKKKSLAELERGDEKIHQLLEVQEQHKSESIEFSFKEVCI